MITIQADSTLLAYDEPNGIVNREGKDVGKDE